MPSAQGTGCRVDGPRFFACSWTYNLPRTQTPEHDFPLLAATAEQTPDEEAPDILAKAIRNQAEDGASTWRAAIRASGCHKPQSFIETKHCTSTAKNGTAWPTLGLHAQLSKNRRKALYGPKNETAKSQNQQEEPLIKVPRSRNLCLQARQDSTIHQQQLKGCCGHVILHPDLPFGQDHTSRSTTISAVA